MKGTLLSKQIKILSTMIINKNLLITCLIILITSCVDKFWPNVDKYENLLVVDGMLTNGNDTISVRLSTTSSINDIEYVPLSGADVFITDENQNETLFTETETGNYLILDSSFSGQIGSSYQLHIILPNGKSYISDNCKILPPSPIDSVYGLPESFDIENENKDLHGIQFYIDFHNDLPEKYYHLWKLTQTYKYQATFNIDYSWEGELIPFPNPDSLRTCWRTTKVNEIFVFSNKYLDGSTITRFPLVYVSTKAKDLSIRYSLLVNQLSISEDAYNFWNALKDQNIDQGNMYSRQPIQIRGNIRNVENTDEPVLGYFIVAGIEKRRIYLNRPNLPFYYAICNPDYDLRFLSFEPESLWPIYLVDIMYRGLARSDPDTKGCFDCRLYGGKLTPPGFWED